MRSGLTVLVLAPLLGMSLVVADLCPGEKFFCQGNSTCCRTDSDKTPFICCVYPAAVCCADGRHCCRQGFTCHRNRCVRTPPVRGLCPDGRSRCPEKATCCQMPDRHWGCCPYQHAVCCPDMLHCCPQGTRCDMQTLTCVQATKHPMMEIIGKPQKTAAWHTRLLA